jgi:hypothetical protein
VIREQPIKKNSSFSPPFPELESRDLHKGFLEPALGNPFEQERQRKFSPFLFYAIYSPDRCMDYDHDDLVLHATS